MRNILLIIHQIGFVIGVASATGSDILFLKSIKNPEFFLRAKKYFTRISKLIWMSLLLLLVSGIFLYIPKIEQLIFLPSYQAKLLIVAIIVLNGLFLNFVITPKLNKFESISELETFKTPSLVSGVISIVSWYSALFLGFTRTDAFTIYEIIFVYLLFILVGIFVSHLLVDILFSKHPQSI